MPLRVSTTSGVHGAKLINGFDFHITKLPISVLQ